MRIEAHAVSEEHLAELDDRDFYFVEVVALAREAPANLYRLLTGMSSVFATVARRDRDRAKTRRCASLGAEAGAALFASASSGGDAVRAVLDGEEVTYAPMPPSSITHAGVWLQAFELGAVARDKRALDLLCATPASVFRAEGIRAEPYALDWVEALRALWTREPVAAHLASAFAHADPTAIAREAADHALLVAMPALKLLYCLFDRDGDAFNGALATALERHREYWSSSGERREDPDGFIALAPLAIACLANDAGIAVEVESAYAPSWLIRRQW